MLALSSKARPLSRAANVTWPKWWFSARSWAVACSRATSGIQLPMRVGWAEKAVTVAWAYW